jgi:phage terminase large subunit GpA-like protein
MGSAQVVAIKGVEGFNRVAPVVGPAYVDATEGGRKIRGGARLWTVAVATFKSETYRFLMLLPPVEEAAPSPAGYVHLPRGVDAEWVKQQLVTVKTRRGFTRLEWQKLRERNEALDCRVYARAAAWIAGIDRWTKRRWQELERQLGIETKLADSPSRMPRTPAENRQTAGPDDVHQAIVAGRRLSGLAWRRAPWLAPVNRDMRPL